jgi:hypothetical protein
VPSLSAASDEPGARSLDRAMRPGCADGARARVTNGILDEVLLKIRGNATGCGEPSISTASYWTSWSRNDAIKQRRAFPASGA